MFRCLLLYHSSSSKWFSLRVWQILFLMSMYLPIYIKVGLTLLNTSILSCSISYEYVFVAYHIHVPKSPPPCQAMPPSSPTHIPLERCYYCCKLGMFGINTQSLAQSASTHKAWHSRHRHTKLGTVGIDTQSLAYSTSTHKAVTFGIGTQSLACSASLCICINPT